MFLQCVLVLVVIVLVIGHRLRRAKMWKLHAQLKTEYRYLPIIGHAHIFLGSGEDRMNSFKELARQAYASKYGMVSLWQGDELYIAISEPEASQLVLKSHLDKGPLVKLAHHLIGNGSAYAPVNLWRSRRRILSQANSPKHVNNFVDVFESNSNVLVERLEQVTGKGDFSLWDYLCSHALDSACETIFGEKLNVQKHSHHPFSRAFVEHLDNLSVRLCQFWLHNDALYQLMPVYSKQNDTRNLIHEFVNKLIKERRNIMKAKELRNENYDDEHKFFVELLWKYSGGDQGYSDVEIAEESLTLILAATDTSTAAAGFTLILLSQHLDVQEKLYQEVKSVLGDSNKIKLEDISKLVYLEAVIKESMRLYPPAPVLMRTCHDDVKLSSGLELCKGSQILVNVWGLHHNPHCWGSDVEQFKPERFLNPTSKQLAAFMPFSYAIRNCVGSRYAMIFLKITLAHIILKYRLKPASSFTYDEKNPLRVKYGVMLKHIDQFKAQLECRN